jgi:hypothetical protein
LNSGNITFNSGSNFDVEIGGTTACSGYDQMAVTGTVDLGSAALNVTAWNNFVPSVGNVFTIIDNDLTDDITGIFNGLSQGDTFTVGSVTYQIAYDGGDGNDVTLTVTAVATTTTTPGTTTPTPTTPNTGFLPLVSNPLFVLLLTTTAAGFILLVNRKYDLLEKNKN